MFENLQEEKNVMQKRSLIFQWINMAVKVVIVTAKRQIGSLGLSDAIVSQISRSTDYF